MLQNCLIYGCMLNWIGCPTYIVLSPSNRKRIAMDHLFWATTHRGNSPRPRSGRGDSGCLWLDLDRAKHRRNYGYMLHCIGCPTYIGTLLFNLEQIRLSGRGRAAAVQRPRWKGMGGPTESGRGDCDNEDVSRRLGIGRQIVEQLC